MRYYLIILFFVFSSLQSCSQETGNKQNPEIKSETGYVNPGGITIETRFNVPEGYKRIEVEPGSFGAYLRQLPLKPHGTEVKYYDGSIKENKNIYDAVINLDIGDNDLHQCADAIMRLRAEYFWNREEYDKIHFNFTNGFRVDYSEWMKGKRISVNGNKTSWVRKYQASNSYQDFWDYLEIIFMYAGTLSLEKELESSEISELKTGDIFIRGGSPGHAVIVVDMAFNPKTNEKIFLLAQSYMPAQELQVLKNPSDEKLSPWYSVNFGEELETPEWKFSKKHLKKFE